jgi:hypothetical protein
VAAEFVKEIEVFEILAGAMHAGKSIFVGPTDTGAQSFEFFAARGLGDDFSDQVAGGFFERACRFACFRITNDGAIRRVRSFVGDSSEFQGFRICPAGVSVIAPNEGGAIGEDFVEIFFVRQSFRTEHGVVPARAEDPGVAGVFGGEFMQHFLNVGGILRAFKMHAVKAEGTIEEVDVAVNEPGENEPSAGVDYFGAGAAQCEDFVIRPYGDDGAVADGDGLRPGLLGVDGIDFAMEDDKVGGIGVRGLRVQIGTENQKKNCRRKPATNEM